MNTKQINDCSCHALVIVSLLEFLQLFLGDFANHDAAVIFVELFLRRFRSRLHHVGI